MGLDSGWEEHVKRMAVRMYWNFMSRRCCTIFSILLDIHVLSLTKLFKLRTLFSESTLTNQAAGQVFTEIAIR